MDTKRAQWSSLAEFLQSKKLSEYIPTFSTLNLQAFSNLTPDEVEKHVSPIYDRKRVTDAVRVAKTCLQGKSKAKTSKNPFGELTPTKKKQSTEDALKTPTGSSKHQPTNKTPTKSPLRPTKSLSPPMGAKSHGLRVEMRSRRTASFNDDLSEGSEEECKGEEEDEESNLVRLRHTLGSSDPELSSASKQGELDYQSYHRSRNNRRATEYRLSAGDFSPGHSPCPSPRTLSPSRPTALPNLTPYATARRWSVASSDYYSGSPSSLSSASSQERLYNFPGYRVSDEDVSHGQHPSLQRQHSHPDKAKGRPRARSLSPDRSSETSFAEATFYGIYKERFPQAKDEMEKKLESFVEQSNKLGEGEMRAEANANFIHHRVTEIAKDILAKSKEDKITDTYFQEVSSTLDKLMHDSERTNIENTNVVKQAATLLKIISRTGRLLECLQFDASTFYSQLNDGPSKFDELLRSTASLPRYISSRLSTKFGVVENEAIEPSSPTAISSGTEDEAGDRNQFAEDDFEQRKLISNGAYGEVFLVRHKTSKELFALKRIRKDRVIERSEVERAFMERDILSFVHNPFVVSMLCSFQTKTHLCMVLEYVEGGDVGTLLKNVSELDIETARLYHGETVLALEYIHSYGIVHRDLKPENLLITKEGHIKLTDFGLSRCGLMQMATRTLEHGIAAFEEEVCTGTPDYIAPEVVFQRAYGFSVDWWSMGIILYQFLVGCTPFHGDTMETLFESIDPNNIEWPVDEDDMIDPDAVRLILALLEMDPMARLGARGAQEVKEHEFYASIHWDQLMMHKAEFIPYLDSDEDTSYFDSRTDRYDHSITEDSQKFSLEDSTQFKYFDTVNWSADHFSVIQHSPREAARARQASYDSVDSVDSAGTDNQPSISTDDGQGSSGEQTLQPFDTSTPVKVRPVENPELEEDEKEEEDEEEEEGKVLEVVKPLKPAKSPVKKLDLSALINQDFEDILTISISKGMKGYGFVLQAIKVTEPDNVTCIRHLITEVDKCGSAAEAGLIVGHLINECNNMDTHQLGHQQLVSLIKEAHDLVVLKVQHISTTSITAHKPSRKGKKKRRQNSFLKKASMVHGRAESSVVSMEKLLHLTRKTREKQNSDSDKSGGEDALIIRGQQIGEQEEQEAIKKHGFHLRHKGCRRRTSNNFVAPVSPLARTPSPTNHMCYFTPEMEVAKPAVRGAAQKTLHYPHPRSQSMSSVKDPKPKDIGLHLSPVSRRKMPSPRFVRKTKTESSQPNLTHPGSSQATGPSDSLSPISRSQSTRERKKSWVSSLEDKDSL